MKKIVIEGGRIIDPFTGLDIIGNVYIQDGKIITISTDKLQGFEPDETIDAADHIVTPGFVDLKANVPLSNLESFKSALQSAAASGITHLASPAFCKTHSLGADEINLFSKIAKEEKLSNVFFIGALTKDLAGHQLNELMLLKESGCIGFSNGSRAIENTLIKRRCYDYAAMLNLKIFIALEDSFLNQNGSMHEGEVSARLGLFGLPTLSETLALSREILLIEEAGISAHFYHISAEKTLQLLQLVDKRKLALTCDTTIHHLFFTENNVQLENGFCHVRPPFRTQVDREKLRDAVKAGVIDVISSDHIALPIQFKEVPFADSLPGVSNWPVLLPLILRLSLEHDIPLPDALACITSKPAAALGIDGGQLKEGMQADITIFDPTESWSLSPEDLQQFGSNTPFLNWPLQGRVKYTLLNGKVAYKG